MPIFGSPLKVASRNAAGAVLIRIELREILPNDLVGFVAFEALGALVPAHDVAVRIHQVDGIVADGLHEEAISGFRSAESMLIVNQSHPNPLHVWSDKDSERTRRGLVPSKCCNYKGLCIAPNFRCERQDNRAESGNQQSSCRLKAANRRVGLVGRGVVNAEIRRSQSPASSFSGSVTA